MWDVREARVDAALASTVGCSDLYEGRIGTMSTANVSVAIGEDELAWARSVARREGKSLSAVLTESLAEKRARCRADGKRLVSAKRRSRRRVRPGTPRTRRRG
jgi:hypothetical protein